MSVSTAFHDNTFDVAKSRHLPATVKFNPPKLSSFPQSYASAVAELCTTCRAAAGCTKGASQVGQCWSKEYQITGATRRTKRSKR
jgi:hypothetical protein